MKVLSGKRPIDVLRDSAKSMQVGGDGDDDDSAISEMIPMGDTPETVCDVLEAGGVDLYNWSAVREFDGEHGGSRCASWQPYWEARTVRSRLGPRQQAHCSSPAKRWSPGHQPLLVLPRKLVQTTGTVADLFRRVDAL
jgi:hypothetical protein